MESQRHLFQLPSDLHYINGAYMSPLLRTSEEAGIVGIARKRNPALLEPRHFFEDVERTKKKFAELINARQMDIAINPAASYGLMNAIQNVPFKHGQHAIIVSEEFPSGHFALQRWCKENNAPLHAIGPVAETDGRTQTWNQRILESISIDTAMVVMSAIHWMDGTKFDLEAIGNRCAETNTFFIVDGSQTVGALPMDVSQYKIDALICATYKWLLGPYSMGIAYYGEQFAKGIPIEESWMNRSNAMDFSNLTVYDESYKPGAARYSTGEATHLIQMPMLEAGLDQIRSWGVEVIQAYCKNITSSFVTSMRELGLFVERDDQRAFHLFGLRLPDHLDTRALLAELKSNKIVLSLRGNSIRVSPNMYNDESELKLLTQIISNYL